jgi:hypothetical protein
MAAPLSQDLRKRLVGEVEQGSSARQAAARFVLSPVYEPSSITNTLQPAVDDRSALLRGSNHGPMRRSHQMPIRRSPQCPQADTWLRAWGERPHPA